MITIDLGTTERFIDDQFVYDEVGTVRFEYSLKVLYEWECKWLKPFLNGDLSDEETIDFYKMMALDPIEDHSMTIELMQTLFNYIREPQTATTFTTASEGQNGNNDSSRGKLTTSEEIYASMFASGIPLEFENRNLNRLLVILRVMSAQNSTPKKMDKADIYKQNASLNAMRKQQLNTKG